MGKINKFPGRQKLLIKNKTQKFNMKLIRINLTIFRHD